MTRSEALEAMARGMERESWSISAAVVSGAKLGIGEANRRKAEAALQALEEGGVLLSFEEDSSSRDLAQSTTVAPPSGLAGPTSSEAQQ